MRHLRLNPNVDRCSETCPERLAMDAEPPVDEWDWYWCPLHAQWWRAVLSPDADEDGVQQLQLQMTDRPEQLLLRRLAVLERLGQ